MSLNNRIMQSIIQDYMYGFEDTILDKIRSHMYDNPYRVVCSECGDDLKYDVDIDHELDMRITVHPCRCSCNDNY